MSSKAMSKLSSRPIIFISAGLVLAALAIPPIAVGAILWPASEAILRPSGPGGVGEIGSCSQLAMQAWGTDCGRLSARTDIEKLPWEVQSDNEYMLSGWILRSNAQDEYRKVLLYVPGGGSDRREASRYVDLAHSLGFDLASFDPVCHGISPCIGGGVSYGDKESVDVRSAVRQLTASYRHVVVMGSSVGALSILRALPSTHGVDGVILENPMESLYQLLRDARESEGLPDWMVASLAGVAQLRAGSSAAPSAVEALRMADLPPLLFIHSKSDQLVPFDHTVRLAAEVRGEVEVWLPEQGDHGQVWNANPLKFEGRVRRFLTHLN
ncbi:Alpha/beta hydrolase family protein [Devosia equisanguinis]|uniref:Alpha/beta hydrolase family protein n=1 Tax=Devosia equisanguinis TaxID=2490941 RepID=A0A3S4C929_9HYPH|nr:alpha/beta hydrolase [Devosia equisanguinis]VDS02961.1 Alpha/beta hydrolase family protein [Devosia equisanguinis]